MPMRIRKKVLPVRGYSYFIYERGSYVVAENGMTRKIEKKDTDAATVINYASQQTEATGGGTIKILPGDYIITDTIRLGKAVSLEGCLQGDPISLGTHLEMKNYMDKPLIEVYTGASESNKSYYYGTRIRNLTIHGDRYHSPNGCGIVLAWTMHAVIENIYFLEFECYALKILRSYWTRVRDCYGRYIENAIKIGAYGEPNYNNGTNGNLPCNVVLFDNVHMEGTGQIGIEGLHIKNGYNMTFIECDFSGYDRGVHVEADANANGVKELVFLNQWLEMCDTGFQFDDLGSVNGVDNIVIFHPRWNSVTTQIVNNTDARILQVEGNLLRNLAYPFTIVTDDYTLTEFDQVVGVDTSSKAITITLPSVPKSGKIYTIKDVGGNATTNPITITPASGTIDGVASLTINTNYGKVNLITDGMNWYTI